MTKLTPIKMKSIIGGKVTGAFLTGIAAIIAACSNSLTGLISTGFSLHLATKNQGRIEGSFKTNNGNNLTWSDKHNNLNNSNYNQILFV